MTPQELQQVLKQHAQDESSKDAAAGLLALLFVGGVYAIWRLVTWILEEYFVKK